MSPKVHILIDLVLDGGLYPVGISGRLASLPDLVGIRVETDLKIFGQCGGD